MLPSRPSSPPTLRLQGEKAYSYTSLLHTTITMFTICLRCLQSRRRFHLGPLLQALSPRALPQPPALARPDHLLVVVLEPAEVLEIEGGGRGGHAAAGAVPGGQLRELFSCWGWFASVNQYV